MAAGLFTFEIPLTIFTVFNFQEHSIDNCIPLRVKTAHSGIFPLQSVCPGEPGILVPDNLWVALEFEILFDIA